MLRDIVSRVRNLSMVIAVLAISIDTMFVMSFSLVSLNIGYKNSSKGGINGALL
jgi:hypothetical protein